MRSFAEKLREARSLLEMSQEEFAEKIGVSRRSVISYEKGEKVPRDRILYKAASVLGVSVKYLKDENCTDPEEDIDIDLRVNSVTEKFKTKNVRDAREILSESCAFLAGGDVPMEEKDAFFNAVMSAYVKCKEQSKEKYGRKK